MATRVILKLETRVALAASAGRGAAASLRPLFDSIPEPETLGLVSTPTWFLADLDEAGPSPWDSAHAQVALQLGIAASQYAIVKEIGSAGREQRAREYLEAVCADPVRALQLEAGRDEPFALLHALGT